MKEVVDFTQFNNTEEALRAWLEPSLSLRVGINIPSNPPPPPPPLPSDHLHQESPQFPQEPSVPVPVATIHRPTVRARRNPNQGGGRDGERREDTIVPPFPWATDRRAIVHSLEYLIANGITSIEGEVQCRRCERRELVSYDLQTKFAEVERFAHERIHTMHERAPPEWLNPVFGECGQCGQPNCMRPVLTEDEENYNWLFLFLGQSLGICTLGQLKWFCKNTQNHRTGAKDRVLYLSYVTIGKQLDPEGVFKGW